MPELKLLPDNIEREVSSIEATFSLKLNHKVDLRFLRTLIQRELSRPAEKLVLDEEELHKVWFEKNQTMDASVGAFVKNIVARFGAQEKLVPVDTKKSIDFVYRFFNSAYTYKLWLEKNDKHRVNLSGEVLDLLGKEFCSRFGSVPLKVDGNTSDGYHTFNELYDHRCLLWINLCLVNKDKCYLVPEHFEGWFLLGMKTDYGQMSYHCPNKFFDLVKSIKIEHPEYDGHTSNDVIERLTKAAFERAKEGRNI